MAILVVITCNIMYSNNKEPETWTPQFLNILRIRIETFPSDVALSCERGKTTAAPSWSALSVQSVKDEYTSHMSKKRLKKHVRLHTEYRKGLCNLLRTYRQTMSKLHSDNQKMSYCFHQVQHKSSAAL